MPLLEREPKAYDYAQYWKVSYKETRPSGEILNFKTIIYCKSKAFALNILKKKTDEDNPGSIVSCVDATRINDYFRSNNKNLSVDDWFHIRNASFPNEVGVLFKK